MANLKISQLTPTGSPGISDIIPVVQGGVNKQAELGDLPISTATQTVLDGKSSISHTHTASNITDFDVEVGNNTDVRANTTARHTHSNKTLLDAITNSGPGTNFLADDGTYKAVSSGSSTLDGLTDVAITSPVSGQALIYDGTQWENTSLPGGGDMLKAVYDVNNNGIVDNSEALGGQNSAYHLNRTNHTGTQALSTIVQVNKIGNPINIDGLNEIYNHMYSSGIIDGCAITNNGDGTVSIASGSATLRATADSHSTLYSVEINAQGPISLTDNSINYIYIDYNAGSPIFNVGTSVTSFNCQDKCIAYTIVREGTTLHIVGAKEQNVDSNSKYRRTLLETSPFTHVIGGTALGPTGTRNLSVTAGAFYYGLEKISHSAFDTSLTDTFSYYYRDGVGGFTKTILNTQINNLQYDNGTGSLATLSNNRYGVFWIYVLNNNPTSLAVQYGQGNYSTIANAQSSTVPTGSPAIQGVGVLIGRIIIQKNATSFAVIESALTQSFSPSTATIHNGLAGLQGGAVDDYYHLTSTDITRLAATSGTNTGDDATNTLYSGLATSKQDTLVSGTNIKTVNGNSLLGSGDLTISSGGSNPIFQAFIAGEQTTGLVARYVAKGTQTLAGVKISLSGLPTGANFKVQAYKNGIATTNSIFTSDASIDITTAQGATNGIYITTKTTIDNGSLVENDVLYFYVTQVGSTLSGVDLEIVAY